MTTDRDNLAAILLAFAEGRCQGLTGGAWTDIGAADWTVGYIRDNIARFRIKPEVVDVVAELKKEIYRLWSRKGMYVQHNPTWDELTGVVDRITALRDRIKEGSVTAFDKSEGLEEGK